MRHVNLLSRLLKQTLLRLQKLKHLNASVASQEGYNMAEALNGCKEKPVRITELWGWKNPDVEMETVDSIIKEEHEEFKFTDKEWEEFNLSCVDDILLEEPCMPEIGGTKHDSDKLRMDLIPTEMMEALAQTLTYGVKKYDDNNWRKGLMFSRVIGATLRHFTSWQKGVDIDEESGLNHLDQAFTNIGFLVTFVRENRTELDDRWKK